MQAPFFEAQLVDNANKNTKMTKNNSIATRIAAASTLSNERNNICKHISVNAQKF